MSVFISYSTKDSDFVDKLADALVMHDINIWLDKWEMKVGDSLMDKLQTALDDSSFLLVVLSQNSVESEWCKRELYTGLMKEIKQRETVVLPVLIDDCKMPAFLNDKIYADFTKDFEEGFKALLKPLSRLTSKGMGRIKDKGIISDYYLSWDIIDKLYHFQIDIAIWYEGYDKSMILQIITTGNDAATKKHLLNVAKGQEWLTQEMFIFLMDSSPEFQDLKILIGSDKVYERKILIQDSSSSIQFDTKIRSVLMGVDDGNDVLYNLKQFITMLKERNREFRV